MKRSFAVRHWQSVHSTCCLGLLLLFSGTSVGSQQPRAVTLSKPEAELAEAFTSILSLHELADGRVIVSDSRDKVVQVVDFKTQSLAKVGGTGAGPGEYNYPQRLYALRGDTSLLYDVGNQRYLVILPNGKPGSTRSADDPSGYRAELLGIDNAGRVYLKASRAGSSVKGRRSIIRYNPATKQTDSITTVAEPVDENIMARSLPGGMLRMSTNLPFASRDVAAVAPDGSVIVARISDYHVEHFDPSGKRTVGSPVAFTPIVVDAQEKRAFMEGQIRPGAIISQQNAGTGAAAPKARSGLPPGVNNADIYDDKGMSWPTRVPAFLDGALSVDRAGRVWVKRTVAHNQLAANYDVFDATAKRVLSVTLPPKAKLVGFGRNSVYLVRVDDDDLQFLQRFALPR